MEKAVFDLSPLTRSLSDSVREQATAPSIRLSEDACSALLQIAIRHDVAHLLTPMVAMAELSADSPVAKTVEQKKLHAFFRCEQQLYESNRISAWLTKEAIPYLPLKGTVLRPLYPEPWMRSCGDLDILIPKEQLERAVNRLCAEGFRADPQDSHDVSLYSESGVHVELHFSLTDPFSDSHDPILDGVWESVHPLAEHPMEQRMTDPFFYYYHIAHMAKHIRTMGGCGIRPFLDLWVLWNRTDPDREAREALLAQGGLLTFGRAAEQLARVWFDGEAHTELTKELEQYVLRGEQGNKEQEILTNRARQKTGRLSYAFSRIFLRRDLLETQYPVLRKHPSLLPVCQVRRWFRLLFGGKLFSSAEELQANGRLSEQELTRVDNLLRKLEL